MQDDVYIWEYYKPDPEKIIFDPSAKWERINLYKLHASEDLAIKSAKDYFKKEHPKKQDESDQAYENQIKEFLSFVTVYHEKRTSDESKRNFEMIDFIPHYIDASKRESIKMLESSYPDGYKIWFSLLEKICQRFNDCEELLLDFSQVETRAIISAYCGLTPTKMEEFLTFCSEINMIDKELWEKRQVWIETLRENLVQTHKKKRIDFPLRPGSLVQEPEKIKEWKFEVIQFVDLRLIPFVKSKDPKVKINRNDWLKEIDKLTRLDNRTIEEINKAWDLVEKLDRQEDDYKYVIMSAKSFREKFPKIILRANRVKDINPLAGIYRR